MDPTLTTSLGATYSVESLLGQGGQGTVYRLKSQQGLAAKVLNVASTADREVLRNRVAFVRSLPLSDLPIAMPIDSLAPPRIGYTMQLLREMVPVTKLIRPDADETLSLKLWYAKSGGSVRRLRLMAKTCDLLSDIHARGLCYGDISPRNIFVSERGADAQVWLIDADNLRYLDRSEDLKIYTPGYGAPEVLTGRRGVSTLTDAHSMAVLAFQCLTLVHPLIGDYVDDGDPDLEEKALQGDIPWIEHATDAQNRSSKGIPRSLVLSPNLRKLFEQFFVAGLKGAISRPGVALLAQTLHAAADFSIKCQHCGQHFYPRSKLCPWCDSPRPNFLLLKCNRWDPTKQLQVNLADSQHEWPRSVLPHVAIPIRQGITLTARIISGATGIAANKPVLKVSTADGNRLLLERLDDFPFYFSPIRSSKITLLNQTVTELPVGGVLLHAGPANSPHRVFELLKP